MWKQLTAFVVVRIYHRPVHEPSTRKCQLYDNSIVHHHVTTYAVKQKKSKMSHPIMVQPDNLVIKNPRTAEEVPVPVHTYIIHTSTS